VNFGYKFAASVPKENRIPSWRQPRSAPQHTSMTFNAGIEDISPKYKIPSMTSISMPSTTRQEDMSCSDIEAQAPPSESPQPPDQPPHTIPTEKKKIFTIVMASFAAFISPVSASIYYPALNELTEDLHVTAGTTNLPITVYMVCLYQDNIQLDALVLTQW